MLGFIWQDNMELHFRRYILHKFLFSNIRVFGAGLNCYKSKLMIPAIIRVIDDEGKFSFWYIKVSAYYAYNSRFYIEDEFNTRRAYLNSTV